jgi:cell division protein FtsN
MPSMQNCSSLCAARPGQRGSTLIGFIVGLVLGLGIAVAVALYLTNAPIPFVNKVQRPTENVKPGADGKLPDPNKPLYGAPVTPPPPPAGKDDVPKIEAPSETKAAAEQAAKAAEAADEGTRYVLQAGAFKTAEDADTMRARLAMLGLDARVFPVEQGGATLYRVRLGPYGQLDEVNRTRKLLSDNKIDAQVIRLK